MYASPYKLPTTLPTKLQELPPEQAHFCLSIESFLRTLAHSASFRLQGKTIVIGLSGGTDSTALLLILFYLQKKLDICLGVVHVDHCLRAESADEAKWCQALCVLLKIPCIIRQVNVNAFAQHERLGTEEAARKVRYQIYSEALEHFQGDLLCTGHHLNDLAEDVVMRLIRGVGWPGLGGMPAICHKRKLLRPLLLTPKARLESFLATLDVFPMQDASNYSDAYFRNRVRKYILPLFVQENPAFLEQAAQLWQLANLDAEWLEEITPLPVNADANTLNTEPWDLSGVKIFRSDGYKVLPLPKPLRLRHYKRCLELLGQSQPVYSNLMALDAAWQGQQFPKTLQFSGGISANISQKYILWTIDNLTRA